MIDAALKYIRSPKIVHFEDDENTAKVFQNKSIVADSVLCDLGIERIVPINYSEAISKGMFNYPAGILIDINLDNFNLKEKIIDFTTYFTLKEESINITGQTTIRNGIDLAKYLYSFNSEIPIAVYSADLESKSADVELMLEECPSIMIFDKSISKVKLSNKQFISSLIPFLDKVKKYHISRENNTVSLDEYSKLTNSEKTEFLKEKIAPINSNKFFELVDNYSWFALQDKILTKFHGSIIKHKDYDKGIYENFKLKNNIKTHKKFPQRELSKLSKEKVIIPFWNFNSVEDMKENLEFFSKDIGLYGDDLFKRAFNLQAAPKLATFVWSDQISLAGAEELIEKNLDNLGKKEFYYHLGEKLDIKNEEDNISEFIINRLKDFSDEEQYLILKQYLLNHSGDIDHPKKISELISPFSDSLRVLIDDMYEGEIFELEEEENRAWVSFDNVFNSKDKSQKPFKYEVLKKNGIVEKGTKFLYSLYSKSNGDITRRIEKVEN